ncbi:MAG: MGMT family protein, partial [Actinomycetota bacterium]|nr:MGMT family protein [Actinomycetota bacterium]
MPAYDIYVTLDTALGPAFVVFNAEGVCRVAPGEDAGEFEADFEARFGRPLRRGTSLPPALRATPVPVDWRDVSPFDRAVLAVTQRIPHGQTRTYREVAERIGRPKAMRAVGSALARNRVPLLVPCHRVVRSDGTIGDFAFGAPAKRALLESEGVALPAPRAAGAQRPAVRLTA